MVILLTLILSFQGASCADAPECRRQALEAAARGDYETAHDLAWRAVQKGTPNDTDLMFVLARTQSLSGRPGDALVMLGRIADRGVSVDVSNDPDFRRVRALPGWPDLAARLSGTSPAPSAPSAPAPSAPSALSAPAPSAPDAPLARSAPVLSAPPARSDALSFSASPGFAPFALAHDAVSRRFVVGDRQAHRLLVVDDVSRNVSNYVSAASAGFYDELTAFTIDSRRGDLWVASARMEGDGHTSVVHKLQLVSGRTLLEVRPPERSGSVRFAGLAVTNDGTVYAVDSARSRLFRARPGARTFESVMPLDVEDPSAVAATDDHTLYVAGPKGLTRVDVGGRNAAAVKSAEDLGGFESLAWRGGAVVGVQRFAGSYLIVRVKLDPSGTRAQPRQILAASPTSTVGSLAGDSFYYLAADATIRRVTVR